MSVKSLEADVAAIKERNKRVELDKAWETSLERRALIAGLTYFVFLALFQAASVQNPYFNALVPSLAFLVSTATLGFAKAAWLGRQN